MNKQILRLNFNLAEYSLHFVYPRHREMRMNKKKELRLVKLARYDAIIRIYITYVNDGEINESKNKNHAIFFFLL